jgi:hypothetical protein
MTLPKSWGIERLTSFDAAATPTSYLVTTHSQDAGFEMTTRDATDFTCPVILQRADEHCLAKDGQAVTQVVGWRGSYLPRVVAQEARSPCFSR